MESSDSSVCSAYDLIGVRRTVARFAGTASFMLAVMAGASGCASLASAAKSTPTAQRSASPAAAANTPLIVGPSARRRLPTEPVETPSVRIPKPADPTAPLKYQPVKRGGKRPSPTLSAGNGAFTAGKPVAYPDGLRVQVTAIHQSVETGTGPGIVVGRPHTAISITLTNKTKAPISLNQVVVTTTYGNPRRIASPVYNDPSAADFFGTVVPGKSASATYVVAIPTSELSDIETVVDFDANHVSATFRGTVK